MSEAGYRPNVTLRVLRACGESWEQMPGDSRVRHCAGCDRDVHNLAAMTPREIDGILSRPGLLPCMRMVQFEDGSLLTTRAVAERTWLRRVGMGLSAAMLMAGQAMAQAITASPVATEGTLHGTVTDSTGEALPRAKVLLTRRGQQNIETVTDVRGEFSMKAAGGEYELLVTMPGFAQRKSAVVHLQAGRVTEQTRIQLAVSATLGELVVLTDGQALDVTGTSSTGLLSAAPMDQMPIPQRKRKRFLWFGWR